MSGNFGKEVWGSDVLGSRDSVAVAGVGVDVCLFLPESSSAEVKIRMLLVKKYPLFVLSYLPKHAKVS